MKFFYILLVFIFLQKVCYAIDSQLKYEVSCITVEGNNRTKTPIIWRELLFKEGDEVDLDFLDEYIKLSENNLKNTNLFLEAEITYKVVDSQYLDILVQVQERSYLSVLPNVLLGDRSFNEWWYERHHDLRRLTYGVGVVQHNVTGNADNLGVKAFFGFTPYVQLSYSRPYIDKEKRFGFSTAIAFATKRSMGFGTWSDKISFLQSDEVNFKSWNLTTNLKYRKDYNFFHTLSLVTNRVEISDTIVQINPEFLGNGLNRDFFFNIGYELKADFRDNRQYPMSGRLLVANVHDNIRKNGKDQLSFSLIFNQHFLLRKNMSLEVGLRGKTSFPSRQSYYLLSGLGYGQSLARGYELYVIDGQHYVLNRNTLRVKAFERKINITPIMPLKGYRKVPLALYPNIYADYGFVKNYQPEQSNSSLSNKSLIGGGIGLDVVSFYNLNFRLYYSINQMGEKGLYFSLVQEY